MIADAPARPVGKGALDNVVGGLFSSKSLDICPFESHTVERAYLYQLELDTSVVAYRTQVRLHSVEGRDRRGKRYVTSVTADVLVLREDSVTIVECKSLSWLRKQSQKTDVKWFEQGNEWRSESHEAWAKSRGIRFEVFAQDDISGLHLQNLEFLYAVNRLSSSANDEKIIKRAVDVIAARPFTTVEVCALVPGFNNKHAGMMISRGIAHGMLRCQSMSLEDHFILFSDANHAKISEALIFEDIAASLAPIDISRPILTATPYDLQLAISRHERIVAMREGKGDVSERTRRLERQMIRGVESGLTEIESLLGRTHNSGPKVNKLDANVHRIISETIEKFWTSGVLSDLDDLYEKLKIACDAAGVSPCSKSTLRLSTKNASTERRALATGGMRAYQATKKATPANLRSLPPIAYGHTLHIDSSSLDNRSAPNLAARFPAENARFYVGVDGATGNPMAHALIFGPARTDGLAILMREYVARNGFLPSLIIIDRGTENTSKWFRDFCLEAGISWMLTPTGGSRYNGLAENVIGRVNSQFAHRLPGSTKPDQFGRAVDGKFKSRKTALISFSAIADAFKDFLYCDLANSPNSDNISPKQMALELRQFGEFAGRPAVLDAAFLILTSIRTELKPKIERGCVRTSQGKFSSAEFQIAAGTSKRIDELRRDCINPSVMFARLGAAWYQVFNRAALKYSQLPDIEKLWHLLVQPIHAADAHGVKLAAKSQRHSRHEAMVEAAAHPEVSPPVETSISTPEAIEPGDEDINWEELDGFVWR